MVLLSKADEMLEHLGYERVFGDGASVIWEGWRKKKKCGSSEEVTGITFNSANGTVTIETVWKCANGDVTISESSTLDFEEIQAINEKVKELGWLK